MDMRELNNVAAGDDEAGDNNDDKIKINSRF